MAKDSTKNELVEEENIDGQEGAADESLTTPPVSRPVHHRLWHWLVSHKKISIPAGVGLLLIVLFAIPVTRFAIAGTVLKQNFSVTVIDKETKKPVSSVTVKLAGETATTNNKGAATIKARVGSATLHVEKKYYKTTDKDVVVPILKQRDVMQVSVQATGRQVPVTVINKVTQKPLANAKIAALGAEAKTDNKGQAVLVLPASESKTEATVTANGYNRIKQELLVTAEVVPGNTIALTPAGKVYFLSNQSGKIDVVKTNLDGSDRQTVLAGTGNEDNNQTVLLASTDWKYAALLSKRDGGANAKLFLIDTATDKTSTMDEGDANFSLIGWSGHTFAYSVYRTKLKTYDAKQIALKAFNAENKRITTLDESQTEGNPNVYAYQSLNNTYLIGNQLIYTASWSQSSYYPVPELLSGKTLAIRGVQLNGQGKKDYKTFDAQTYGYANSNVYEPNSIRYQLYNSKEQKQEYYEFEDNAVKQLTIDGTQFGANYPTHLFSPDANHTLWADTRDGKNVVFTGDKEGKDEKQVATLEDSQAFGWYSDDYILVSKKGSELYILPVSGLSSGRQPLKVSDYFKPDYLIRGYGGGYGL